MPNGAHRFYNGTNRNSAGRFEVHQTSESGASRLECNRQLINALQLNDIEMVPMRSFVQKMRTVHAKAKNAFV